MKQRTNKNSMKRPNRKTALLGATAIAVAVAGSAAAQDEAIEDNDTFFQDVVVVTAQRREEGLQDVPVSVTAASGEQLELLNATDVADLEFFSPGLLWGEGGSSQWPTIRGVNTPINENIGDPAVAFFMNGVYKSRTAQALTGMIDVERSEVLRGPQGTLFGRNATAGAINVITRKPSEDFDYRVSASAGNYSSVELNGMVNIPVSDTFQMRFAGIHKSRDGYVENIGGGPDLNDEDMIYGRASFRLTPNDQFEAIARIAGLSRDRAGGAGFNYKVLGQSYEVGRGRTIFGDAVFINPRVFDGVSDIVDGVDVGDIGIPVNTDPYLVDQDFPNSEDTESFDIDLELNYDFGDIKFQSITAYADFSTEPIGDNDFISDPTIANQSSSLFAFAETFTQEFKLSSDTDGPLEWVAGVFFLDDQTFEVFAVDNENGTAGPFPNRDGEATSLAFDRRTNVDTQSYAVYGQGSFNLTDQLSLTAGVRYTSDTKEFRLREFGWLGTLGFNPDLDSEETFEKVTYRIGAEYEPVDGRMLYASYATGFRSGGFNRFAAAGSTDADTFDSEEIRTFEIGSKNEFGGGIGRLNVAAYFSDLVDQQVGTVVSVAGTGQSGFDNAGSTEIYGFDAELQFQPTPEWFLLGTLAYNNSEYKEYLAAGFSGDTIGSPGVITDPSTGAALVDLAGNRTERSPRWRTTLLTGYEFDLGGNGTLTPILSFAYTSDFYSTQFNTEILQQDDYTKTDLRLVYRSEGERFSVEGFIENIEDEAVIIRGTYGGSNAAFISYAAPQTFGVRVTASY